MMRSWSLVIQGTILSPAPYRWMMEVRIMTRMLKGKMVEMKMEKTTKRKTLSVMRMMMLRWEGMVMTTTTVEMEWEMQMWMKMTLHILQNIANDESKLKIFFM